MADHTDLGSQFDQRPDATKDRLGYRPALDGVRAVAISLVLLVHTSAILVPAWQTGFFPGGFLGVDVFLVLSGFLITTLLLERHGRERHPIATFYARRILRLVPAVLALLTANLAFAVVRGHEVGDALRTIPPVLLYITNWAELAGLTISRYVTHLWTLAVEEQFYLVWPILLFGALRLGFTRRKLVFLAFSIAILSAAWRAVLYHGGDPWLRIYLRTDARADSLAIGAALAVLPRGWLAQKLGPRLLSLLGAAGLATVIAAAALLLPEARVLYLGGFTVIALALAVLIAAVVEVDGALARSLAIAPLIILGRLSYSLYLWHFGVFQVVAERTTTWSAAPRVVVAWAVTFLAAGASYRFVELPALRLKSRLGRGERATIPPERPAENEARLPADVAAATADAARPGGSAPG